MWASHCWFELGLRKSGCFDRVCFLGFVQYVSLNHHLRCSALSFNSTNWDREDSVQVIDLFHNSHSITGGQCETPQNCSSSQSSSDAICWARVLEGETTWVWIILSLPLSVCGFRLASCSCCSFSRFKVWNRGRLTVSLRQRVWNLNKERWTSKELLTFCTACFTINP